MRTLMKFSVWVILLLGFAGCETELEKYYKTPDWLKGNAWQVLEDRGNFSIFLSAVEKSSYKDLVQGKGLITVMAPTDEAFGKYLQRNGYSSIESLTQEELDILVGYHLVYYSFTKEQFENYTPNGSESVNMLPGVYYKFRTKSRDGISTMYDPATDSDKKVVHKERFLPIFSYNIFNSYMLEAKSNYEYFYPGSTWTGDNGFNVSNASVEEYALVTDNGYVYVLNEVIEPLETIYNELKKTTGYSKFLKAYDRFVTFVEDANETLNYGSSETLYEQTYSVLPSIATEWTGISYQDLSNLSRLSYNIFAPDDNAMQAFFDKYWAPYYSSLDNVNFIPTLLFLQNHTYNGSMLFPEQVESGLFMTDLGTTINFNRSEVGYKKMCVNGSIYGLSNVFVPSYFEKVSAPMLCDPQFNMFLDMTMNSGYLSMLSSDNINFKVFYPSDQMLINNTTLEGKMISYVNTNSKLYGAQSIQIEGDDGPVDMNHTQKRTIAGSHIASELISKRGTESIYRTLNSYNYIYIHEDSVFSSQLYNKTDRLDVPIMEKIATTWSNGEAYYLRGDAASALVPESNQFKNIIASNIYPIEYQYFKALIDASGLTTSTPAFSFLQGDRYVVFLPTDAAILAGLTSGKIPMSPATAVANYLKNYFIKVSDSNLLDYPFSGTGVNKTIISFGTTSTGTQVSFKLTDDGSNLYLTDAKGNNVKVLSYFPHIYADAAVYLIDGVLEVE